MLVTTVVGELTESDIREALDRGRQTGIELVGQHAIQGVLLCLRDQEAAAGEFDCLCGNPAPYRWGTNS